MGCLIFLTMGYSNTLFALWILLRQMQNVFSVNECRYITPSTCLNFDIIDLTHTIGPEAVILPLYPPYNLSTVNYSVNERYKIWVEDYYVSMPEHTNTHVDEPAHMYRNRPHMHEVPMRNLVGPGVIIDVRHKAFLNPLYGLRKRDLLEWERSHGRIPDGSVVIVHSGWHHRYPDKRAVFNTHTTDDPESYRYPSLTIEAVDWLLDNRRVIAVGIDTPTVDFLNGRSLPVHRRLFKDCVNALEGEANLDRVPPFGSTINPALKLYHGSGAPARIFATVPLIK